MNVNELEVSVPELVCAGYRVRLPSPMRVPDIRRRVRRAILARLSEPLRGMAVKWLDEDSVFIEIEQDEDGASIATFGAAGRPTLLALQEWRARGSAAVFAAELSAPVLDLWDQRLMTAEEALSTLPETSMRGTGSNPLVQVAVRLSGWVHVAGALQHGQAWMFTDGMRRFGLPEMRIGGVSPRLREELTAILTGAAYKLYRKLVDRETLLKPRSSPSAVIQVPTRMDLSRAEADEAVGAANRGGGTVEIGLRFHPAAGDDDRNWLTIWPPRDCYLRMEDFIADICHGLFGFEKPQWYYIPEFGALLDGVASAVNGLPALRDRFVRGNLPRGGRPMLRHRVDDDGQVTFRWGQVDAWDQADCPVVRDVGRELSPGVKTSPALPVELSSVVDWAVWADGTGVVEGGATEGRGPGLV